MSVNFFVLVQKNDKLCQERRHELVGVPQRRAHDYSPGWYTQWCRTIDETKQKRNARRGGPRIKSDRIRNIMKNDNNNNFYGASWTMQCRRDNRKKAAPPHRLFPPPPPITYRREKNHSAGSRCHERETRRVRSPAVKASFQLRSVLFCQSTNCDKKTENSIGETCKYILDIFSTNYNKKIKGFGLFSTSQYQSINQSINQTNTNVIDKSTSKKSINQSIDRTTIENLGLQAYGSASMLSSLAT